MSWPIIALGIAGLGFRIWVNEFKVKPQILYERHFTSRILTMYCFLAMAFDFQSVVLNLVIACAFPMMAMCIVVFDIPFFVKHHQGKPVLPLHEDGTSGNVDLWVVLERLTLHVPITVIGLIWYPQGLKTAIFPQLDIIQLVGAIALVFIPFLTLDQRITKKKDWPDGLWLLLGSICWAIGFTLHFFVWDFH